MKRIFAILILFVSLALCFSACTQTETTGTVTRWEKEETQVFDITKTNWNYPSQTVSVSGTSREFTKYPNGLYESTTMTKDETEPEDVGGTYTTKILLNDNETEAEYTTEQHLFVKYETKILEALGIDLASESWQNFVVSKDGAVSSAADLADAVAICPLTAEDGMTVLYSYKATSVKFKNEATQRPLQSSTKWDGFYIGKTAQEITHYDISAVYDYDNKKVTITEGEKVSEQTISTSSTLIDSNQLLLYTRSLEKTSTKFKDSPSVQVYSTIDRAQYTANFSSFSYTCYTLAKVDNDDVPVILNCVGISVNSLPILVQLNLPDTVTADSISTGSSGTYNKYTTTSFRSGLYHYEISSYDSEILKSISVSSQTSDAE